LDAATLTQSLPLDDQLVTAQLRLPRPTFLRLDFENSSHAFVQLRTRWDSHSASSCSCKGTPVGNRFDCCAALCIRRLPSLLTKSESAEPSDFAYASSRVGRLMRKCWQLVPTQVHSYVDYLTKRKSAKISQLCSHPQLPRAARSTSDCSASCHSDVSRQ
jgi:hypothetical protein